jgi:hypothetical protein
VFRALALSAPDWECCRLLLGVSQPAIYRPGSQILFTILYGNRNPEHSGQKLHRVCFFSETDSPLRFSCHGLGYFRQKPGIDIQIFPILKCELTKDRRAFDSYRSCSIIGRIYFHPARTLLLPCRSQPPESQETE